MNFFRMTDMTDMTDTKIWKPGLMMLKKLRYCGVDRYILHSSLGRWTSLHSINITGFVLN